MVVVVVVVDDGVKAAGSREVNAWLVKCGISVFSGRMVALGCV